MNKVTSSLDEWHALHALSKTMLDLAHSERWDELIAQEVKYVTLVEDVVKNPVMPEDKIRQNEAKSLLEKILANEATLKTLLQNRMLVLRNLIDLTGRQKTLNSTYGNLSGTVLIPGDFDH